jgi:hypothetical protein
MAQGLSSSDAINYAFSWGIENKLMPGYLENLSSEVKNMLYSEFNLDEALAVSFEDGVERNKVDNAKNALSMGISIKDVSKITGLDEKTIVEIKNGLPN